MPTVNPRVNVTLSPSLHTVVADLAVLQRVSKSMVLRDLLEAVEPSLTQVVAMMRAAQELNAHSKAQIRNDVAAAVKAAERSRDRAVAVSAAVTEDLVAKAEAIRGRRPGKKDATGKRSAARSRPEVLRAGAARTPLPSKRGVKS